MAETPVRTAILVDLLVSGDDKAENIGRRTGHHRNSVSGHMGGLVDDGLIKGKGGGVYRLTDSGRERATGMVRAELSAYKGD